MTKEALKLALDFIENSEVGTADLEAHIKEALAQPEPVAFFDPQSEGFYWAKPTKVISPVTVDVEPLPLYTSSSPQRTWVRLTDEELQPIADEYRILFGSWVKDFARVIEAKLKAKNT